MTVRETTPEDIDGILAIYPLAFPDEELRPLVTAFLRDEGARLSLAGFVGRAPAAHVLFTLCDSEAGARTGALLGPLAVAPAYQQQGWGTSVVHSGFDRLAETGVAQVFVLGNPSYYHRFGFHPERLVTPPYPLAAEWTDAWQSKCLASRPRLPEGRLRLPHPWMEQALWQP
ncbi:MAG: N-acetyltransferase [Pseudomonadota bacterium]